VALRRPAELLGHYIPPASSCSPGDPWDLPSLLIPGFRDPILQGGLALVSLSRSMHTKCPKRPGRTCLPVLASGTATAASSPHNPPAMASELVRSSATRCARGPGRSALGQTDDSQVDLVPQQRAVSVDQAHRDVTCSGRPAARYMLSVPGTTARMERSSREMRSGPLERMT
jgi:hypothetical protein